MNNDTQKINRFTSFVDNSPILKQFKIDIYLDIQKCGWFGTSPLYCRFIQLFTSMREHYINENQMTGSGDVLRLTTQDMKDFCQYYVNEYQKAKDVLSNVIIS